MIVLDASAAIHIARKTEEGESLAMLMEDEPIASCDLYRAEVRNAFWQYVRADLMKSEDASDCVEDALGLVDEYVSIEELGAEAFKEAIRLHHSVYDMLYLCLARRFDATLFTLDKRLASLCEQTGVNVLSMVNLAV